ncbi:MAG TPA: 4-alpha-glucanotransferase [Bradyrhizobium sp.]|uniref:4-alpha-glucanotransferase n=1 Tax=Bradyrhizobium sp. TaxID=376 RepID=UPI002B45CA3B|nr:4-alpha-glucanotransferase [Bradyrhizobium sp.]HKO70294.1 4-alpha-glucanotransferase [Bradyrhizobium sp.]
MDLSIKAKELGIHAGFIDAHGRQHVTDEAALKAIVEALPRRAPHSFLDDAVVVRSGFPARSELRRTPAWPLHWKITADEKVLAEGVANQSRNQRDIFWPPDLPTGCYRVQVVDANSVSDEAPFIAAPRAAYHGDFERCWLLAVQLYGIRSPHNWGIGDFSDLERLIELAAQLGADGVGLNPLHVLFDDRPADCSPYSPNSRLFLNPLYIDIEKLPGFQSSGDNRDDLARLRQSGIVGYFQVATLKWRALRSAFDGFKATASGEDQKDFENFRRDGAALLLRFACFEVLRHKFHKPWWEWPDEWRQPDDLKCARLRQGAEQAEIEFIEFVQWNADRQLGSCRRRADELGMKVGLYLDVAVGVQSDGFDAWNEQSAISRQLAVGAPPDMLNTAGQNWGLAGFNAAGLEICSFEPYRQMLRASMRHAGAIRLDHVLGLKRLYLVPEGFAADNGVYVQMPFEALLAVTAQESVAHRCVVIGEDLGTVPEGFREQMADWGIWSYQVMMFERDQHGRFRGIDDYARNALVTFNTHDLSTYAGWRSFSDLKLKRSLGVDPGETDDSRWHALTMLTEALRHHGDERHDLYAVVSFLARTKSRLLAISLEDLLGLVDQPNIPGTVNEHPNWRQRLPLAIEEIAAAIDVPALRKATAGRTRAGP